MSSAADQLTNEDLEMSFEVYMEKGENGPSNVVQPETSLPDGTSKQDDKIQVCVSDDDIMPAISEEETKEPVDLETKDTPTTDSENSSKGPEQDENIPPPAKKEKKKRFSLFKKKKLFGKSKKGDKDKAKIEEPVEQTTEDSPTEEPTAESVAEPTATPEPVAAQ
eukprot:CAMPEP_0113303264 /NCGR_PEP_ID=MMETSP0010_2-20120614/3752_1 /TAXON_ID=216773 ORGANISM="Corethron hystrix, Strain 308" /NCGR_SAMPLE_ID=MMETSP0010_2 /ASSEMBLY_ACC=CAM_ASM_000155 /LENGTH=164 /DNA_ID=CAMNT_0000157231 /DNA_START=50 /DNA_END=544 /DNA_ORIENTATION=- /assembly_acc=CAM_ASM_000155